MKDRRPYVLIDQSSQYYSTNSMSTSQDNQSGCFGVAKLIEDFGDTEETKDLIEKPEVQKLLLDCDYPYQCARCKLIFFVRRNVIDTYSRVLGYSKIIPKVLVCINSYTAIKQGAPPGPVSCKQPENTTMPLDCFNTSTVVSTHSLEIPNVDR